MKLIADSIAQQQQAASRAVILNPIFAAFWIVIMSGVYQYMYKVRGDWGLVFTTGMGVTMAMLIAVRISVASSINGIVILQ
jgi:hypothetical protein